MPTTLADMHGKVCLITGANRGLGKATALGLARLGATVVLVCRNLEQGEAAQREIKAASGNPAIELIWGDLSFRQAVRRVVSQFQERHYRLDVLINNAAVFTPQRLLTPDGLEMMFATNHLGPFLLTNLLLDHLQASAPARIINITAPSTVHLNFDDLQGEDHFQPLTAFGASKMANLLFTYYLARRVEGSGVTVNALHPGLVKSDLMQAAPIPIRWVPTLFGRPAAKAAEAVLFLAASPSMAQVTGLFLKGRTPLKSDAYAYNPDIQQRLWAVSAALTHLIPPPPLGSPLSYVVVP